MKKIFLIMLAPFAFLSASLAQVTQAASDSMVLERMSLETKPHTVYAKIDNAAITTQAGELLELDYPCQVYYIRYDDQADETPANRRYFAVTESNGNVLEVKTKNDVSPQNLATWRLVKEWDYSIIAFIIRDTSEAPWTHLFHLYIMDKSGNNVRKIADDVACSGAMHFHFGTKLLFYKRTDGEDFRLYSSNFDGADLTLIDIPDDIGINLSPDETQTVCFKRDNNNYLKDSLRIYNLVNKTETILPTKGNCLLDRKFSPDGTQIFYLAAGDDTTTFFAMFNYFVYKIDIDGNNNQVFLRNVATLPVWSPQGDKIAYTGGSLGQGPGELFVANTDGSNPQQLTFQAGIMQTDYLQWTPNGEKIVVGNFQKMYIINADGSGQTQLTNDAGYYIEITPDGEYIIYDSSEGICRMKIDGSERKILHKYGSLPIVCKWLNNN